LRRLGKIDQNAEITEKSYRHFWHQNQEDPEMDVRPGGVWHQVMQAPNGSQFTINSVFLEVVEPEKLVWTSVKDEKRNPPPPTAVTTVTLEVHGTQTKWTLVARFDSIEKRDRAARMGFAQIISQGAERIAEVLQTL
jgi:uncharacterized protein YndB with AHSA1/START domain